MRIFQVIIVFLLLLQVASAHEAYSCRPISWATRIRLTVARQVPLAKGKLAVDSESCTMTQNDRYMEICNIGTSTLMVSFGGLPSVLILPNGAVHKMDCRSDDMPRSQQQQQQQQQQEQQDSEVGDHPGHGGGTIRGKNKGNE